jgi:nitrous oxidase accessory protein
MMSLKKLNFSIFLVMISFLGSAEASIISVSPGHSIQAAINAADQEDVIEVQSGTYYENLNVFKPLVLRGAGHPIINAADSGSGITLHSDGAVIEGFIIVNSSASKPGINISSSSQGNVIKNNTITRNRGNGIDIWASKNNSIFGNILGNNKGNGLSLWSVEKNHIMKNFIISNNGSGIFGGCSNSSIIGNLICKNNGSGIVLLNSFNNNISMNQANDNKGAGIMLIFGSNNSIADNTANNNGNSAISLLFSWKNKLLSNTADGNLEGIYLGNSSEDNIVTGNEIGHNRLGVHLGSSNNNSICQNYLNRNDYFAFDDGINQWDSGKKGNYYSDLDCLDANRDGICDKAIAIPGGLGRDRYPLASYERQNN